jgi:hypothetical protein
MPFNDQPRPAVVCRAGEFFDITLGLAKRKCRGCKRPITKGEYHLDVWSPGYAHLRLCEECLGNLYQWCKRSNRRNL